MEVNVNGLKFKGLMDSGATISCLGRYCVINAEKMNTPIMDLKSSIRTADGKTLQIIGKIKIQCGKRIEEMTLYLVPNLQQDLILGYDFLQRLGIKICVNSGIINENRKRKVTS